MGRTRIKICGICSPEDANDAVTAGVDAIGMVFYKKSPRNISLDQARAITEVIPPFVTTVGLFVNSPAATVNEIVERTGIDLLQFHGDEPEAYCQSFGRPYIKAIRITPGTNLEEFCNTYHTAKGILVDSFTPGIPGGTGKVFDWNLVTGRASLPVILAGGLDCENVSSAITQVQPWAVDVSSGVEDSPGNKNRQKMLEFVRAVVANDHI